RSRSRSLSLWTSTSTSGGSLPAARRARYEREAPAAGGRSVSETTARPLRRRASTTAAPPGGEVGGPHGEQGARAGGQASPVGDDQVERQVRARHDPHDRERGEQAPQRPRPPGPGPADGH